MTRRRWVIRPRDDDGVPSGREPVVVEVADGAVVMSTGAGPVPLLPADVSRVRQALLDAQAVALTERGRW